MSKRFLSAMLVSVFCSLGFIRGVSADSAWIGTGDGGETVTFSDASSTDTCYDGMESYKWRVDCSGVSWAYYKYYKYTGSGKTNPSLPVVLDKKDVEYAINEGCATGGFWHFGVNSHGAYFQNGVVNTGGTGAYYGHWGTYSYGTFNNKSWPYDMTLGLPRQKIGGYQLEKYGTIQDVLSDYKEAYKIAKGSTYNNSNLPSNVYAFCYNKEATTSQTSEDKIYSRSYVANGEPDKIGNKEGVDWFSTGLCDSGGNCVKATNEENSAGEVSTNYTTNVGSTVEMVFTHNLFSSIERTSSYQRWNINRVLTVNGGEEIDTFKNDDYYVIESVVRDTSKSDCKNYDGNDVPCFTSTSGVFERNQGSDADGIGKSYEKITFNKKDSSGTRYVANPRYFTDGSSYYLNRDVYNVTFKKAGVYRFCEKLVYFGSYANKEGTRKDMTVACSEITVKDQSASFQGEIRLTDGVTYNSGWGVTGEKTVKCTTSGDSCHVKFGEWLKQTEGQKDLCTVYRLERFPYDKNSYFAINKKNFCGYSETRVENSGTEYNIPVGKTVCEKLYYLKSPQKYPSSYSSIKVCVTAEKEDIPVTSEFHGKVEAKCYDMNSSLKKTVMAEDSGRQDVYCQPGDVNFVESLQGPSGESVNYSINSFSNSKWNQLFPSSNTKSFEGDGSGNYTKVYPVKYDVEEISTEEYVGSIVGRQLVFNDSMPYVKVNVPYNFTNTVCIRNKEKGCYEDGVTVEGEFLGGESKVIDLVVTTNTRKNSKVGSTYATKVTNAKTIIQLQSGSEWVDIKESEQKDLSYNTNNYPGGKVNDSAASGVFSIPDNVAGTKMCIRAGVYPASSVKDTQMDDNWENAGAGWAYSGKICFKIAKKPSIQVWGGSVYTNGDLSTPVVRKRKESNGWSAFGSWVEHGILRGGGVISGLGSGASLGYPSGVEVGWGENLNKLLEPLTIPSRGKEALGAGSSDGSRGLIIDYVDTDNKKCKDGIGVECEFINTDYDLGGVFVDKGTKKVIYSTGNATIYGDITYADNYSSIGEIPKLIIFAEKNINIQCNVGRIDAVLIAKETVNTCSNGGADDDENRSNQLKINGSIIADKLKAGRTYGAGVGKYAVIPAEIIDYDASLYLWSAAGTRINTEDGVPGEDGKKLTVTNVRELAPRL